MRTAVEACWTSQVLPSLAGLAEIPALSPAFAGQITESVAHLLDAHARR